MEFTLLWAAAAGAGAAYLAVRLIDGPADTWDRVLAALFTGMAVGRLTAMVVAGVNPLTHPGDILIIRGGVDPVGATVGALASAAWTGRRRLPTSLDDLAVAALAGMAGWHAGCVARGACVGARTDFPLAVEGRHPVELYAAVGLVIVAVAAWWLRHRIPAGAAAAAALGTVGVVRLATEPLRVSLAGGPTAAYVVAGVIGVVGAILAGTRWRPSGVPDREHP